jgi:hypothetical protein
MVMMEQYPFDGNIWMVGEVEDKHNTPKPWWKGMEWIVKKTNLTHGGNQIATIRGKATEKPDLHQCGTQMVGREQKIHQNYGCTQMVGME